MIKLTRKTEYALLALRYLHGHEQNHVASVKDIANHYSIPSMLLAKVMQQLKKNNVVSSIKGMSGGYALSMDLNKLSFLDFISIFEDDTALVECLNLEDVSCRQLSCCDIREPLSVLNAVIQQQLRMLTVHSLFSLPSPPPNRISISRISAGE